MSRLSSFFRAWYLLLGLGFLTFVFTAFVGQVPHNVSSAVALPHSLLYRTGINVRRSVQDLVERRDLQDQVTGLSSTVASLREENRQLTLEVQRLREALAVREDQSPGVVATAAVTGGSSGPLLARLTLDKGSRNGVLVNMPVTVPAGLVGIVTEVASGSSVVRTVVDPASRVGVTVRDKGGAGVAVGEIGGRIRVTRFIEDESVEVGDAVETSSYGGLFPRGVLVGIVDEVLPPSPNELRLSFLVRPAVDLPTLLEVVLTTPQ